jgi:hypothetical protein
MTRLLRAGFDRVVRTAPLGVQFRDAFDQRVVADGLRVDVHDALRPGRTRRLAANRSGVFVAHALPGLAGFGDAAPASPPAPLGGRFSLTVQDPLARYLPLRIGLDLPCDGLFEPDCLRTSPGSARPHVPLYSAPTRALPAATVVVRADLRLASDPRQPARWAWMELRCDDALLATGMADAGGGVLLFCPQPAPREPTLVTSPPVPSPADAWEVTLHARWSAANARDSVPDLCRARSQAEVGLLHSLAPPVPLASRELRGGQTLVVASVDSSFLFVAA